MIDLSSWSSTINLLGLFVTSLSVAFSVIQVLSSRRSHIPQVADVSSRIQQLIEGCIDYLGNNYRRKLRSYSNLQIIAVGFLHIILTTILVAYYVLIIWPELETTNLNVSCLLTHILHLNYLIFMTGASNLILVICIIVVANALNKRSLLQYSTIKALQEDLRMNTAVIVFLMLLVSLLYLGIMCIISQGQGGGANNTIYPVTLFYLLVLVHGTTWIIGTRIFVRVSYNKQEVLQHTYEELCRDHIHLQVIIDKVTFKGKLVGIHSNIIVLESPSKDLILIDSSKILCIKLLYDAKSH